MKSEMSKQKRSPAKKLVRLNKFLADSGLASRRKADELIESGQILLNGKKVFELGVKVDPSVDKITYKGKPVNQEQEKIYLLFNKPKHVLSSMKDPEGRRNLGDFFSKLPIRVFPVGRLDWDSEGLLIMTNDGEMANRIIHPKNEITKYYLVKVDGHPSEEQLEKLRRGVSIIGGKVKATSIQRLTRGADKYDWFRIGIDEGKNRQIRRMFEKIGFDVLKLQRVAIGGLELGRLARGEVRILTPRDLKKIFSDEFSPELARVAPTGRSESRGRVAPTARSESRGRVAPRGRTVPRSSKP